MRKHITYIILVLLVVSCGSRKSEVQKKSEEKSVEVIATDKKEIVTDYKVDRVVISNEDEFVITPVDVLQPIEVIMPDGKKTSLKNAKIEKRKINTVVKTKETINKTKVSEIKIEAKEKEKSTEKTKEVDRRESYSWIVWILIILLLIYLYYRIKKRAI